MLLKAQPNKRFAQVSEIGALAVFLASDGAAGVNGPVRIDSGLSANNTVTFAGGVGDILVRINVGPENAAGVATIRSAIAGWCSTRNFA
mgnify:CR=1 FL=1